MPSFPRMRLATRRNIRRTWSALQGGAGSLQPGERVTFELRGEHVANAGVIGVPPRDLGLAQQVAIEQRLVDRRQRQRLEAQPFALAAFDRALLDQYQVFDA